MRATFCWIVKLYISARAIACMHAWRSQPFLAVCTQTPRSPGSASAASTPSAKAEGSGGWHSPLASWRSSISSVSSSLAALSPRHVWGTSGIGVQLKRIGDSNVAIKGLAPGGPAQVRQLSDLCSAEGRLKVECVVGSLYSDILMRGALGLVFSGSDYVR